MKENYIISTAISHPRRNTSHPWNTREEILETAKLATSWLKTRLWQIAKRDKMQWHKTTSRRNVFHAWDTYEDILERAKLCTCWGLPRSRDWTRQTREDAMLQHYMMSTTISHPRTVHVKNFPRVRHPRRHFSEGKPCNCWGSRRSRAWKHDCGTSLDGRRCKETTLHDIDSNLTSTLCSRRDISHAWDIREDALGRARPCSCWGSLRSGEWKRAKARL